MARSDTVALTPVHWNAEAQMWLGPLGSGVHSRTLGRAGGKVLPVGELADNLVKVKAEVRANRLRLKQSQARYAEEVQRAASLGVPVVDIASILNLSRQRVYQILGTDDAVMEE